MDKTKNTSVIKEAIVEFEEIQNAAMANAKKSLAESYPNKFNDLLKEELNKSKKSYKKLDENKDSNMENKEKETDAVVKEEVGKDGVFTEKPKMPDVVKEEREKDFMADVESDTPNKADGKTEDGDTFVEKITTKKETLANKTSNAIKEEFNLSELDATTVGTALEGAEDDDEIITMDDIESEINGLDEELSDMGGLPRPISNTGSPKGQKGDAFTKVAKMKQQLSEMMTDLDHLEDYDDGEDFSFTDELGDEFSDEDEMSEQKNNGGQGANKRNDGGPTTAMIDEEDITDADVEAVLGAPAMDEQEDVDESMTMTHANARKTGSESNGMNNGKEARLRAGVTNESKKKISSLINENKGLTKKLNETKKYKQSVTTLVEQYKTALGKYRNQLKEMATFNTNLAHVNNLLVNEELALTQGDKIKIINEFKKVGTIAESQEKYKSFLSEMKENRPTLTESIEGKVTASVSSSSKQKLDEVKEVTAYANDEHVTRMKKLIEYAENRGKKNNLNS